MFTMTKWAMGLALAFVLVAGTLAISPMAFADDDDDDDDDKKKGNPVIRFLRDEIIPKLDEILAAIEAGLSPETEAQIDNIETETNKIQMVKDQIAALNTGVSATTEAQIDNIETETNKIQMVKDNQFVPFFENNDDFFICDVAGDGTAGTKVIVIRNARLVTGLSVLFSGVDQTTDEIKSRSFLTAGRGASHSSIDLTGNTVAFNMRINLLGVPLQSGSTSDYQIGSTGGSIELVIDCDAGTTSDIGVGSRNVQVWGWKSAAAPDVTVTIS